MRFFSVNKPRKCPRCKSAKVVTIVYGLPGMEAFEEAQAGKVVLGGCDVTDDDPSWQCLDCDAKIFKYNRFNEPLKAIPVKKTRSRS